MSNALEALLRERSSGRCELCGSEEGLSAFAVSPFEDEDAGHHVLVCDACRSRLDSSALDGNDWYGLRDSIWSEHVPVQVLSWRVLARLEDAWARDLREQVYFDDETRAWAESGQVASGGEERPRTLDSNGTELHDGDSVTLIKDLDVKGTSFVAKRGTLVRGIRLTDNPEHIEGKVNGVILVLKTMFLKRA